MDAISIQERIKRIAKISLSDSTAQDVAFHMTDWLKDLESYYLFCQSPDNFTDEQVEKLILSFLYHVPNHLAAAAKLFADYPVKDIFGVGAVEEEDTD